MENAIKYSGNNKPVILLVEKDDSDITFHIKDEGKGISVSKIDSIFDGCSQTENLSSDSAKGLGIGLSICKTIINAHGGTITAKNNDGQGAVFTFTLALEAEFNQMNRKAMILVVEDEPNICNFIATTLSANEYKVIECSTGKEAVS